MDVVRVVAVDDHPIFLKGLGALIASRDDVELVGAAENAADGLELVAQLRPDVAIVDLQMPGPGGIELTAQIAATAPDVHVLVLTMFEDDVSVMAAIRAGARGYVLKGARQDQLMRAVHAVAGGDVVFGPSVADRISRLMLAPPSSSASSAFPELTERELEVLELVARGSANRDIVWPRKSSSGDDEAARAGAPAPARQQHRRRPGTGMVRRGHAPQTRK